MRGLACCVREFGVYSTGSASTQVFVSVWLSGEGQRNIYFLFQGMEIINMGPENESWRAG